MRCAIALHSLRQPGEYITDPRHISFVRKIFPEFSPAEKVCSECKREMIKIYNIKYQKALQLHKLNVSSKSISSESVSNQSSSLVSNGSSALILNLIQQLPSATDISTGKNQGSQTTSDDDRPTTSAEAAARQKRKMERQNEEGINVLRGSRLPHIQPVPPKRQRYINTDPKIMEIYLNSIGG